MLSMRGVLIGLQDALAAQRPTVTAISDTEDFLPFNLAAEPAVMSTPEAAARDQQHSASTSGPDDLPWATDVSLTSPLLRLHHGMSQHSCTLFSAALTLTWIEMMRMHQAWASLMGLSQALIKRTLNSSPNQSSSSLSSTFLELLFNALVPLQICFSCLHCHGSCGQDRRHILMPVLLCRDCDLLLCAGADTGRGSNPFLGHHARDRGGSGDLAFC